MQDKRALLGAELTRVFAIFAANLGWLCWLAAVFPVLSCSHWPRLAWAVF